MFRKKKKGAAGNVWYTHVCERVRLGAYVRTTKADNFFDAMFWVCTVCVYVYIYGAEDLLYVCGRVRMCVYMQVCI